MLSVNDLHIRFFDQKAGEETVHGIDFSMQKGEFLGLCGESGSGKTLTALVIAGLMDATRTEVSGEILFEDENLLILSAKKMRRWQGKKIAMVFQEPGLCLNPLRSIGWQMEEMLSIHQKLSKLERKNAVLTAMSEVELDNPERIYKQYPHELSGGMRQRIMLAMALLHQPKLLICDEPTTALDEKNQDHILRLLQKMGREKSVGILFISHDLDLIGRLCSRILVMHDGRIVEQGTVEDIFATPKHIYTKSLLQAADWEGNR